jgi:hypothetical protein
MPGVRAMRKISRFGSDVRGNLSIVFALATLPALGAAGAALEYSRASDIRARMQAAADAGALAAVMESAKPNPSNIDNLVSSVVRGYLKDDLSKGSLDTIQAIKIDDGYRVKLDFSLKLVIGGVIGLKKPDIGVISEAKTAGSTAGNNTSGDIALVLDNTFSMRNDMNTLKDGAKSFIEMASSSTTRISIVPYVAAVNPGASVMDAYIDKSGTVAHEYPSKGYTIAFVSACTIDAWDFATKGGGGGAGPGKGGKESFLLRDLGKKFAGILHNILGISAAHADETPNTRSPLVTRTVTIGASGGAPSGSTIQVPDGFRFYQPCWLQNPVQISNYDLHKRLPGSTWKGCVEARGEPYDVTDQPPSTADKNTLFTSYFWPDEPGAKGAASGFTNNYLDDGPLPAGYQPMATWEAYATILKYNHVNVPEIKESWPSTIGPNKTCPDPVMRLSTDKKALLSKIDGLGYWAGGGTINSEGLMWGWRSLSPELPFADGKPYGAAKKTIILFSDGRNEVNDPDGVPTVSFSSDYTAYGRIGANGRLPSTFAASNNYLDGRFKTACNNAKAKGVEIYTIIFRESDGNTVSMMRACASDAKKAFAVSNGADLKKAFEQIGGNFASASKPLRLTK